jgi:hypothetical protein
LNGTTPDDAFEPLLGRLHDDLGGRDRRAVGCSEDEGGLADGFEVARRFAAEHAEVPICF